MQVLLSLAPDLGIILLGFLIAPRFDAATWQQIDKLCYYVLYPALLFAAASQRAIPLQTLALLGSLGAGIVSTGFLFALLTQRIHQPVNQLDAAGIMQNAWRFNTALGFVAVGALSGSAQSAVAVLAVIVGIAIPVANLYAVLLFTRGKTLSTFAIVGEIALNPFLLASLAGIGVALSGITLASVPLLFIERLADAALPIVLLSLGAALRQTRFWPPEKFALTLHAIKLCALPAVVWAIALASNSHGVIPATLLIFSALPTASAAHVLAARYGADRGRVALVVMQSTALSLLSLPFWTSIAVLLL